MKLSIVAAVGKKLELGKNNNLIWRIKEDLNFFKELTTGHIIVMGRKTFESLPHMLPNRHHIVITRNGVNNSEAEVFNNIDSFLKKYENYDGEIFIIGGASIYKEFMDLADNIYLTEIDESCEEADVYFPEFDKKKYEKIILSSLKDGNIKYRHVLYRRVW